MISLVGSTPGKSTNKNGYLLLLSSNTSSIWKGIESIYLSPDYSATNVPKADITLSGRKALNKSKRWNLLRSLKAFGKSADSAFSSPYHFFHYKTSVSKDEVIP